jgi:hypothetical protein
MSRRHAPLLSALLSLLVAAPASAQLVRGSVVDSATSHTIGDFTVQLLDSTGTGVAAALAQADGRFSLRAPVPGRYSLRVLRIGFRRTETPPFQVGAGETVEQLVLMPQVSVALTGIRIVGLQRCQDLPAGGEALVTAWEEVHKAVQAVALTGSEQRLQVHLRDYTRDVSLDERIASNERSSEREGVSVRPYVSPDAASMAREGYVRRLADGNTWYYAPDADVLLSGMFVSTHCFHLQRDAVSGDSLLGIAFEPVRRRGPPDIRGVLYVHRGSAELRELRYTYTALPDAAAEHEFGGRVAFQRVPGGAWIIREWVVRGPIFTVRPHVQVSATGLESRGAASAGPSGADSALTGKHEGGGEVLAAHTLTGRTIWARSYGSVVGSLTDSASGAGVPGTDVELRGTLHHGRTDDRGTFRFDSVAPGSYTLLVNVSSPVRFIHSRIVRMDSGVVHVTLVLPISRLASEQAAREQARSAARCIELRVARDHEIDSTYAEPVIQWAPRGRDSAEIARAVVRAPVVLQAVADTTGHIERQSVRAVRGGRSSAYNAAVEALFSLPPEADEPLPGCRLRRLVLLPLRMR